MATLYDKSGKPVEVPEEQVGAAIASGELGTLKGQRINVVDPAGVSGSIDAAELPTLGEGWRLESAGETELREAQAAQGGLGAAALTGVENAASVATFGASDVVAAGIGGDEYRESRRQRELANPNAAVIGQVGGIVIPIAASALTGGASGVGAAGRIARAAAAPTRAAIGLGELASTGVRAGSRALLGESTLARAVGRVGAGVAGGAVEGGLYGAGSALSDAALERDGYDHLAEKLIAGAREGAAFGGVAGGLLAGVGGIAQSGIERLTGGQGIRSRAAKLAEETAVHALDPSKKAAREIVGREREIGRELLDRGILSSSGRNGTEEMLERATREVAKTGDEIGHTMKRLDDAGLLVDQASQKSIFQEIKRLIAKRTGETVEFATKGEGKRRIVEQTARQELRAPAEIAVGRRLDEQLAPLMQRAETGTLTHQELHAYRRQMDDLVNWSKIEDKGLSADLKTTRNILEKNLEGSVEANARALGDAQLGANYQAAKKGYAASRWAEKQLTDNMARGQANRWWSLTDTISTQAGLAGSVLSGNIGIGAVVGLLAGAGNKLLRERGAGVLSVLANRVATADTKIARSVGRFVRGVKVAPVALGAGVKGPVDLALAKRKDETRDRAYERTIEALSVPQRPEMIGGLARTAPNVAAATVAKVEQGRQYLLRNLPTPARDPNQIIPTKPPPPDPVKLAQFARRKQVVDRPLSVLKEIENRSLTREHVDALKSVYPRIYDQIRGQVTEQLIDHGGKLDMGQRITIGVLFELPTDPSMKPSSIRRTQAMYQKKAAAQPPPQKGGSDLTGMAKAFTTQSEQLEAFGLEA